MSYVAFTLLGLGLLIAFVGGIIMLVAAFREHIGWGLCCLFVPFASLVFIVLHWAEARRGFLVQISGLVVAFAGFLTVPKTSAAKQVVEMVKQRSFQPSPPPMHTEAARAAKETERRTAEQELGALQAKLNADYAALSARRAKLGNDPAAITAFNEEAARYQVAKAQLAGKAARLEQLRSEEEKLSEQALVEARELAKKGQRPPSELRPPAPKK